MAASIIQIENAQNRIPKTKVICITSKSKQMDRPRRLYTFDPENPEPPRAA